MAKVKFAPWCSVAFLKNVYYLFDERNNEVEHIATVDAKAVCGRLIESDMWIQISENEEKAIDKLVQKQFLLKE